MIFRALKLKPPNSRNLWWVRDGGQTYSLNMKSWQKLLFCIWTGLNIKYRESINSWCVLNVTVDLIFWMKSPYFSTFLFSFSLSCTALSSHPLEEFPLSFNAVTCSVSVRPLITGLSDRIRQSVKTLYWTSFHFEDGQTGPENFQVRNFYNEISLFFV